jgi:hypothetical protein
MSLRPTLKTLDEAVRAMEQIIQREKYGTNERAADERRLREIKAVRDEVLLPVRRKFLNFQGERHELRSVDFLGAE